MSISLLAFVLAVLALPAGLAAAGLVWHARHHRRRHDIRRRLGLTP